MEIIGASKAVSSDNVTQFHVKNTQTRAIVVMETLTVLPRWFTVKIDGWHNLHTYALPLRKTSLRLWLVIRWKIDLKKNRPTAKLRHWKGGEEKEETSVVKLEFVIKKPIKYTINSSAIESEIIPKLLSIEDYHSMTISKSPKNFDNLSKILILGFQRVITSNFFL